MQNLSKKRDPSYLLLPRFFGWGGGGGKPFVRDHNGNRQYSNCLFFCYPWQINYMLHHHHYNACIYIAEQSDMKSFL